jgi:hypothetical protein
MLLKINSQKLSFSIKIAVFGAATGFAFMVLHYLSRVPDHLQTAFLRSHYIPSRLDGINAMFIYGSSALSGFLIAFIFVYWLYDKPQLSGMSKISWAMSSLGYGLGTAFIGGGIFMPLADQVLMAIKLSPGLGTTFLFITDHLFRIPLTMWLSGTQALYSSFIASIIFGLGAFAIYKLHEADTEGRYKKSASLISTIIFSVLIVSLSLVLPVSILQRLG